MLGIDILSVCECEVQKCEVNGFQNVNNIQSIIKVNTTIMFKSTYKVFLKFLHFLLVALQSAVVHGSALDGNLSGLQVHLLQLRPAIKQSTTLGYQNNVMMSCTKVQSTNINFYIVRKAKIRSSTILMILFLLPPMR